LIGQYRSWGERQPYCVIVWGCRHNCAGAISRTERPRGGVVFVPAVCRICGSSTSKLYQRNRQKPQFGTTLCQSQRPVAEILYHPNLW